MRVMAQNKTQKLLISLAVFIALFSLLGLFFPWIKIVENKFKASLESVGFQTPELKVASIGFHKLQLKDLAAGSGNALTLGQITFEYSPQTLLQQRLYSVALTGIKLNAVKDEGAWNIQGMKAPPQNDKPRELFHIPITSAQLNDIPFDQLSISESEIHGQNGKARFVIPIGLTFQKDPEPKLTYAASQLSLKQGPLSIVTQAVKVEISKKVGDDKWLGNWRVEEVKVGGAPQDIPPLTGEGSLTVNQDSIRVAGQFVSSDQAYRINFSLDYFLSEPSTSQLHLLKALLPWQGGTLSASNVVVSYPMTSDLSLNINVNHVSLSALMHLITGKDTTASGDITGILPIVVTKDGTIRVQNGKLSTEAPGVIAMPPGSIPGDNEQVETVRNILKNLHYKTLSMAVDESKDNKLIVLMALEGQNPDVYAGRTVKLNVRLAGDVLNFFAQNVLLLTKPETLLQQGQDAQH